MQLNPASFRDPDGAVFSKDGKIFRAINMSYKNDYRMLLDSGLYSALTERSLLIPHEEVENNDPKRYKVIKPKKIGFISYPYEWCFSQFKSAALVTLEIQKIALDYDMSLKDASAYNIQFLDGRPIMIDTLSFEKYQAGKPWVAYKQFCQHFVSPLILASTLDVRLSQLMKLFIDGIPVDLTSKMLPARSRLNLSHLIHVHLHAGSQSRHKDRAQAKKGTGFSRQAMRGLLDSLERMIKKIHLRNDRSFWRSYYQNTNYSDAAFHQKKQLVEGYVRQLSPATIWDLGANVGLFSELVAGLGAQVVAFELDPLTVEAHYRHCQESKITNILPLVMDLTDPSPNIGWQNKERKTMFERGPADLVLALALIHHLAIANNIPLKGLARFFSRLGRNLIIEFVPKNDSQVQRLLRFRQDIFPDYNITEFELVLSEYFEVVEKQAIAGSERILYLMRSK